MAQLILTIVTVTKNDEQRLARTIDSVSGFYGDPRYEHLIIDGGIPSVSDPAFGQSNGPTNLRLYRGVDSGIYDAMNRGIEYSNAKFIYFLNCGDVLLASPDELCDWLESESIIGAPELICFDYILKDGMLSKRFHPRRLTRTKMPASHQAIIFDAEFMKRNKFDLRYKIAADFDLYLKANQSRISIKTDNLLLAEIERHGVASINPRRAYSEYLTIVRRNLVVRSSWLDVVFIFIKGIGAVAFKSCVPKRVVLRLRGYK